MKRSKKLLIVFLLISVFLVVGVFFYVNRKVEAPSSQLPEQSAANSLSFPEPGEDFKVFSGEEFLRLYNSFAYPNTQLINEHSSITGNEQADKRMRELALSRGYKLRSAPVTNNFVEVQKDMLLQRLAAQPWLDLQASAKTEGISMSLSAAFRSAEDQKTIFLERLGSASPQSIASRSADAVVNKVLEKTALPGYSRHHTGYTVDIVCDSQPNVKFENSTCFTWLNKDNYINAKKHGWIPSYPDGAANQGPEPESWEYVWVGVNSLK